MEDLDLKFLAQFFISIKIKKLPSFKSSIAIDEHCIITFINKRLSIRLISFELKISARELGT
jgi:hypothetical protein